MIYKIRHILQEEFRKINIDLAKRDNGGGIALDEDTGEPLSISYCIPGLCNSKISEINALIKEFQEKGIFLARSFEIETEEIPHSYTKMTRLKETTTFTLCCELRNLDDTKDLVKSLKSVNKYNL